MSPPGLGGYELTYDVLHVGVDSVDSWRGGCTTHFVFEVLRDATERLHVRLLDYPLLVRLNPNIPWRTRGNGAVCLRLKIRSDEVATFERLLELRLRSYTDKFHDCDPAIALLYGELHGDFSTFYERALTRVVTLREAQDLAEEHDVKVIKTRSGLGLIGALAAIGSLTKGDYTYEVLAYREEGAPRLVDYDSVWALEFETWPYTFNNVDPETGRVLLTPHGPDPVLYGIRGEDPETLMKALSILRVRTKTVGRLLFRSNQGTDCHYMKVKSVEGAEPYSSISIEGRVASNPIVMKGGHVVFKLSDGKAEICCVAYEPSGIVRAVAEKLEEGDEVEVCGGLRRLPSSEVLSLNVEKLVVLRAREEVVEVNPPCPRCGKRLKSMGRCGGYKCKRCGFRSIDARKLLSKRSRSFMEGVYTPPPRSMRHLAKPLRRYGLEKKGLYEGEEMELRRVLALER
jgi:tRNA(Ile2)-agmatinylcytidine synthase